MKSMFEKCSNKYVCGGGGVCVEWGCVEMGVCMCGGVCVEGVVGCEGVSVGVY